MGTLRRTLQKNGIQIILGLLLSVIVGVVFVQTSLFASSGESARGFAWGGTESPLSAGSGYQGAGWISMNSLSDGSALDYGVHIPNSDGDLSGYAWSEHYGWISFNGDDLVGCTPNLTQASRSGNDIAGGARIIAIRDAGGNAGGFDGCISLRDTGVGASYGVSVNTGTTPHTLTGYAWSSDLGWIDFSGVEISAATATISGTSCTIVDGQNTCNGTVTWNISSGAVSPNVFNSTTNTQHSTNLSGTNEAISLTYGNNVIQARDGSTELTNVTLVAGCGIASTWSSNLNQCVSTLPNLTQPDVTYTPSTTFDPVTGVYSYVDVTFQAQNDGASGIGSASDGVTYQVRLDREQDGTYDDTINDTFSGLDPGEYSGHITERFNNVSYDNIRIRVMVDSEADFAESNENDNERILDVTLASPNPAPELTADRLQVRNGEVVTLTWDVNATYPMNCSVYGPGTGPVTFDPSIGGATGSVVSQPINAKSEYTLSCTEPITDTTFTDTVIVETQGKIEEV